MERRTRRSVLALAGATLCGGAGCAEVLDRGPEPPDDDGASTPATDTPTDTPAPSLTLEAVEPPLAGPEVEPRVVTVYPESMALALRRAARIEGVYRSHARAFVEAPEPFWTRYGVVRLTGPQNTADDGDYEMDAEGGIRYELHVGADRVTPSEDVDPTPVSDLSEDRRELALDAIDYPGGRVYPETALGEWVRTEWFDGYWAYEGTVYRGKEIQQTDAAFFSDQVWATVEMRETVGHPQVTFELRAPGDEVRDALDPVFAERQKHHRTATLDDPPAAVREYLEPTDLLATHTAVFEPRFG